MTNYRENNISSDDSVLHYYQTGCGREALLVFHGFGQDHRAFEKLAEKLNDRYTLYVFDLFFHGKSTWSKNESPLQKDDWNNAIKLFTEYERIDRFSLLGFSMGAKFALAIAESLPDKINQIVLIAPEGIKINFWYALATNFSVSRKLFKSMILHPKRFTFLARALRSLRLMDKGLIRFAERQMNTLEKRNKVYYSWVVFRDLKFEPQDLVRILNQYNIRVTFIVGSRDKVITTKSIKRFLQRLKNYSIKVLDTDHNGLIRQSADVIGNADLMEKNA